MIFESSQNCFAQTNTFFAKNQPIAVLKIIFINRLLSVRTHQENTGFVWNLGNPFGCILIFGHVQMYPIIESGAFQVLVINNKPKRMNQMQTTFGTHAQTTNISGIVGDFGFY